MASYILANWTLVNKLQWKSNKYTNILALDKVHFKKSAILQPFGLGLTVHIAAEIE